MLFYEDKTFTVATGTDQYIATSATNNNMSHEQYPINLPESQPIGKPLRYLSVCSGMEAASVAWHPLGWEPVGFSEIEPFPCAILKHRFPNVPNYGSLTEYQSWPIEPGSIDLLVGGCPCQSFSVAGLRKGMQDPRGNLTLTYLGLADKLKPKWIIYENVPGLLSSNGGRDFGAFLGALVQLGYGFAYRVLDAQHFRGTPQRRRRVFVVACRNPVTGIGDWRAAAEVLSITEGVRGHLEAGGKKRKIPTSDAGESVEAEGQYFDFQAIGQYGNDGSASTLMARDYKDSKDLVIKNVPTPYTASSFAQYAEGVGTVRASGGDLGGGSETLLTQPQTFRKSKRACSTTDHENWVLADSSNTLNNFDLGDTRTTHAVVEPMLFENRPTDSRITGPHDGTPVEPVVMTPMAVRRLTPVECERLQGFPDNWSRIPWKGKSETECPDGPRYKACGNSMAVPVMNWIGNRIAQYEAKA
jgi:DNA (cytosine-5)-methyltransferase 1